MRTLILPIALLFLVACAPTPLAPEVELDALIDRYLAELWESQPESARAAGLSGYDGRRTDLSQEGLRRTAAQLHAILATLEAIDFDALQSADHRVDYRLLRQHARVRLAEIERFPSWQRDPRMYLPSVTNAQEALPGIYAAGMANLGNPPRLFTEAAIRSGHSQLAYLRENAPEVAGALEEFLAWLEEDLLPRSTGELAAGREAYDFYLRELHGLELNADEVHELGWQIFREVEAALVAQAQRIDPDKDWVAITEDIRNARPERDDVLDAYCRAIQRSRDFVIERGLVTVPPNEEVRCIHSDPSQRAFSPFGTFRVPAPFTEEKVGYIILHPIPEGLTPEREDQLLRAHDFTWIDVIAPHEAYPGHHLQALKAQENPRPLRKIYRTPVFTEGWGLYTEQLMYETGFFERQEETRLTQLRLQLWRAARIILDSGLHTGRISYDEARQFLAERVRMEYGATAGEVGIYIYRPSYAIGYMIGFNEIMDIRAEYKAQMGEAFSLREFHDRMLTLGSIPFPMVRELLE